MSDQFSQILQACPSCATLLDVTEEAPFSQTYCPSCGQSIRARSQFNNFQILEILGEGGMGSVFKAIDQNLRRLVALKILKKEFSSNEEERKRLETEARITASINHPNVVKLYSFGQDHGQFYMAMELVEKGSLDDLINLQQKVAESQVLEVGIQIAQGLEAALERGLIHRDIKPGNILFSDAHTAKIVDFGLATPVSEEVTSGDIWGTPYYIAPEKLNNEPEDFRSDMYSLGASLFHALAGRPPFEAQTASLVVLKHIKNQAVSLQAFAPHVSSETAYVINRILAKNPNERYGSYDEFIEHLQYARNKVLEHTGSSQQQRTRRIAIESQRQRQMGGLVSLLLLIIAIGVGIGLFIFRDKLFEQPNNLGSADNEKVVAIDEIDLDRQLETARKDILEQRYDEAIFSLDRLMKLPGVVPPKQFWIQFQLGLARLLHDERDQAAAQFLPMVKAGLFSTSPQYKDQAKFFLNIGYSMSNNYAISPSLGDTYSHDNFEVAALLIFGIKNWMLGEFDMAEPFLKGFEDSNPTGTESDWIKEYKPIVTAYLSDYAILKKIRELADEASNSSEVGVAIDEIEKARTNLQTGSRISEEFENIEKSLREREEQ